jgi:eukaryotic-like serine/threonine-protein kinase
MVGTSIAQYRIEAELGRGGMGVVYLARDERLRRKVALKLLSSAWVQGREQCAMILGEARAAAALNHPGVTVIYEVGEHDKQLFIAMEFVEGKTLRAVLAQGPLEISRAVRLALQLAEALEAAHSQGVVHGDIKPENIIVQPDERIKLLDFGIARRLDANSLTTADWTPETALAGTLAYMSPEQVSGGSTDRRSDLFSFGVVLFESVVGERPFSQPNSRSSALQMLNERPFLESRREFSGELLRIVQRLLEKDPCDRYQTAHDLQLDLANVLRELETGVQVARAAEGRKTVAVLPFKLLTPNPSDDYLSVALADAVIHALGSSGQLLLRPTVTVERYAKQSVDPLRAARELAVIIVAQGSIQKSGTKLRVHLQAWNVPDGRVLYSAKHDAESSELFALQDELAEGLEQALGVHRETQKASDIPPTQNVHAYELFLRAAERLARLNRWDTRTAIEMLEQAVRLDPKFADAWARLAEACALMGVTQEPHPHWLRRADAAIRRALALDRHSAEAHCARGRVLWTPARGFRNRPALRALQEALHINPGCHAAQIWKCLIFLHLGLHAEAKQGLLKALATHPDDAFIHVFIGHTALYRCDYAEAVEFQARALRLDPANIWANGFAPTALLYAGDLEGAQERIRTALLVLGEDPWLTSCEALLWAKRGETRKADVLIRKALRPAKTFLHTHHLWHNAAATYAVAEKPVPALALLRRASANGLPNYPAFRDDPHFRSMQTHSGFVKLLSKIKRDWTSYRNEFGEGKSS